MKGIKNKLTTLLIILLISSQVLTGCNAENPAVGPGDTAEAGNSEGQGSAQAAQQVEYYSEEDRNAGWDLSASTAITLNGTSAEVSGEGASSSGATVMIKSAGTYVLSGVLDDGQIVIDAGKNDIVRLVLNGASLASSTSAPIYSKQAEKTILILAEGTENSVTDAASYVYAEGEDEPDAAVFAKDDLTITGGGSLNVTGNFSNAIGTKDDLRITGGAITVTAANDGLRGRDGVAVLDGVFVIEAKNDGIKANNDTDGTKGFVVLDGGTYAITAGHDGVQAETGLTVNGGSFEIFTGGGSANAPVRQEDFRGWGRGNTQTAAEEDSESMKGLKAGSQLTITDGNFNIDSEDDAVHSNGGILISGGTFEISTGDDGFHADDALVIDGGIIHIAASFEGLEGATVDINGGEITLKASDDGINAAGGSDGNMQGPMGGDRFGANSSYYIRITAGTIELDAGGDGIDSNGSLYFEGGAVYVSGPEDNINGALDCEGSINVSGGVLVAAGSSGMVSLPDSTSTQPSVAVYYRTRQTPGSAISLRDQDGKTLVEFTPAKAYQSVIISAPGLEDGKAYALYSNDSKLTEITLSGAVTSVSDDGSAVTGGMGPGGRPGRR